MNGAIYSTVIGTICRDPEPFYKVKGDTEPVGCTFCVAINRCDRVADKWETTTQFIELTASGMTAKKLLESKWCKKGYHAYFQCEQSEHTYTRKDGINVKKPVFRYMAGHPILVSASYAEQKTLQKRQDYNASNAEAHKRVDAPTSSPPPPVTEDSMLEQEDFPF